MEKAKELTRNLLALIGVFTLGYWLAAVHPIYASSDHASGDDVQFELQGVNEASSLLVYQPSTRTVYVYRGATNQTGRRHSSRELLRPEPQSLKPLN